MVSSLLGMIPMLSVQKERENVKLQFKLTFKLKGKY